MRILDIQVLFGRVVVSRNHGPWDPSLVCLVTHSGGQMSPLGPSSSVRFRLVHRRLVFSASIFVWLLALRGAATVGCEVI